VVKNQSVIGIIGSGSWATALAGILLYNHDTIHWYVRNPDILRSLKEKGVNGKYLSEMQFNSEKLHLTDSLRQLVSASDILVIAIPSAFLHETLNELDVTDFKNKTIVSAVKGMIPQYHAIPARYYHKTFGIPYERICMISGPCHAEEVAARKLSYLTISALDEDLAENIAGRLRCDHIITIPGNDLYGTELAAVLKNIYAIAAGLADGLGYGVNFQAVLVANAIQEMERFLDAVSPVHRHVNNSAYLGDLLVTAYSNYSRNRNLGVTVGKGGKPDGFLKSREMVAEGYFAVQSIIEINKKFGVEIPIANAVFQILHLEANPKLLMQQLAQILK
jgi:glycerol-3-phosphate dehydrogenase (NAD(P)+)